MTSSGNMIAIATLSTVTLVYLLRPKSKIGREKGRNERPVWRHNFAEILESETVLATILSLIVLDVLCAVIKCLAETEQFREALEEKPLEWAETLGFCCLVVFFTEQICHLVAFGKHFFANFWYVSDLIVVSLSIVAELNEEIILKEYANAIRLVRAWRLFAGIFDILLSRHVLDEVEEAKEKKEEERKKEE